MVTGERNRTFVPIGPAGTTTSRTRDRRSTIEPSARGHSIVAASYLLLPKPQFLPAGRTCLQDPEDLPNLGHLVALHPPAPLCLLEPRLVLQNLPAPGHLDLQGDRPGPGSENLETRSAKTSLRHVYTCDFSCDFDTILCTKPATAYPARVCSRVTLRQTTAKLAEIGMKGVWNNM